MAYTLISSIGTGMYKEGYRMTRYQFDDGKTEESSWFLQALLKKKYRDFDKVILIGTRTSNWDALVDLNDSDAESLWENLSSLNVSKKGISDELIHPLELQLEKQYSLPFKIIVHTDLINSDTCTEVFNSYNGIIPEIPAESNVLFDVTHGFRTMPILMYQNLQFLFSNDFSRKIEIVYGEYVKDGDISYVRDLSDFWTLGQITDAIDIFEKKLDGFKLAELIKNDWEKGSKAIKRFSEIVQTNFALQILDVAKQIKNALSAYPKNAPAWLSRVQTVLEKILNLVDDKSQAKTLYKYSQFLYNHNLNVQAVITLQVAVETVIVEKYGSSEQLGDYEWWQKTGQGYLYKMKGDNWNEVGKPLTNLEVFRNQIAHGGGKNKGGNFPLASNIPNIYKSGRRGIENLFKKLKM